MRARTEATQPYPNGGRIQSPGVTPLGGIAAPAASTGGSEPAKFGSPDSGCLEHMIAKERTYPEFGAQPRSERFPVRHGGVWTMNPTDFAMKAR